MRTTVANSFTSCGGKRRNINFSTSRNLQCNGYRYRNLGEGHMQLLGVAARISKVLGRGGLGVSKHLGAKIRVDALPM